MSDNVNLPNALTLLRIAIAPVLLLALSRDAETAAASAFAAGMTTDLLDGHLARSRGCVTTFGKLFDPAADKLLVGAAFVGLAAADRMPLWIVVVVLLREVLVSALRQLALRRGSVIDASRLGKVKTGLQAIAVLAAILAPQPDAAWVLAILGVMVAATLLSGLSYLVGYLTRPQPAEPEPLSARVAAAGSASR